MNGCVIVCARFDKGHWVGGITIHICRMTHEVFCEIPRRDGDVGVKHVDDALFRMSKVPFLGHACLHENDEEVFVKHNRSVSQEARLV
jgi:hypothetical protein